MRSSTARAQGSVIEVTSPDVVIRGLAIRGSGTRLDQMDAANFPGAKCRRARSSKTTTSKDNLVGVYVHGPVDAVVKGNKIVGRTDLWQSEAGNGIYLWNAPGAEILDNDITGGRDGIFTNVSRNDVFRGNRLHGVRFAIHYMYTNDSEISDNISIGNHAGYVMMYSDRLVIRDNVSVNDRDHGLLFNYANNSDIEGNAVRTAATNACSSTTPTRTGSTDNWFEGCRIGIHFTAGSERNTFSEQRLHRQ